MFSVKEKSEATVHPTGTFTYRFQMVLPSDIPPSFKGHHGNIVYYCDVTIDLPWKFDKECKAGLTVARTIDLNLERPAIRVQHTFY